MVVCLEYPAGNSSQSLVVWRTLQESIANGWLFVKPCRTMIGCWEYPAGHNSQWLVVWKYPAGHNSQWLVVWNALQESIANGWLFVILCRTMIGCWEYAAGHNSQWLVFWNTLQETIANGWLVDQFGQPTNHWLTRLVALPWLAWVGSVISCLVTHCLVGWLLRVYNITEPQSPYFNKPIIIYCPVLRSLCQNLESLKTVCILHSCMHGYFNHMIKYRIVWLQSRNLLHAKSLWKFLAFFSMRVLWTWRIELFCAADICLS